MAAVNHETIQLYLSGEMPAKEAAAFEQMMENDPALAYEVFLYRFVDEEMKKQEPHVKQEEELKGTLQQLDKEFFPAPKAKVVSFKKYRWYAAAAAVAAIIAFIWIRQSPAEKFDHQKLYAYYTADADELSVAVRGSNDGLLKKGAGYFNNKKYGEALPLLQQSYSSMPDDTELFLAIGYCLMQTGNDSSAMNIFDQVMKGVSAYKNRAYWYKALLLLKQNQIDECLTALLQIAKTADEFKDSEKLIEKINSRKK